jgi:translation initiation factor 1
MVEEVCPKCGLPKSICVCAAIEREAQKIKVFVEKRSFGKQMTIIEGITEGGKEMASKLKQKLACGGTFKNGRIELQGDHRNRIKDILVKLGYSEEQIEIS